MKTRVLEKQADSKTLAHHFQPQEKAALPVMEMMSPPSQDCLYEDDCPTGLPVQAKLQVGQANDRYEQEADQVAESIVGNSNAQSVTPTNSISTPLIQRQLEDEEPPFPEEEEPEEEEEEKEEEPTEG